MGKLIEGFWDCKYCDTKAIRGSIKQCPSCGKVRDEDTKFYIKSTTDYVDEQETKNITL